MTDLHQCQPGRRGNRSPCAATQTPWHGGGGETELGHLLQPGLGLRHLTHLARQPDLAEEGEAWVGRLAGGGRGDGGGDRQIGGGLGDAQPARHVEIDIVLGEPQATAAFEHGEQHAEAATIPAEDGATRRSSGIRRQQRLDFHEHRARPLQPRKDGAAGDVAAPLGQEQGGRIRDLGQTLFRHFKDADFVGRAEAVLDRTENAELVAPLAFEIEHRVDHVLHHARAGESAVLGHMPHQNERETLRLGKTDELQGAGTDLSHRPRSGIQRLMGHGLNGVDHQERDQPPLPAPASGCKRGRDILHAGGSRQFDGSIGEAEPARPHAKLIDRLLSRYVDRTPAGTGE